MEKRIIKKISDLINENDPMDLISSGAPNDEYINESSKVATLYSNIKNVNEFKKQFALIFINSFELKLKDNKRKKLEKIGETIFNQFKDSADIKGN